MVRKLTPMKDYLEIQGRFRQILASPEGRDAEARLEEEVSESIRRLKGWLPEYT